MLVDDLGAITPCKLDRVAVQAFDPTLHPNPGYREYGYFNPIVAKVFEESILDGLGTLCSHGCPLFEYLFEDADPHDSSSSMISAANKWLTRELRYCRLDVAPEMIAMPYGR